MKTTEITLDQAFDIISKGNYNDEYYEAQDVLVKNRYCPSCAIESKRSFLRYLPPNPDEYEMYNCVVCDQLFDVIE